MPRATIAIIGRPNVGKSTLFNRLVGQRRAVVEDFPGTTRDRLYAQVEWNGYGFDLIDTGGLTAEPKGHETEAAITKGLLTQVQMAIEEADLLIFILDGSAELTSEDHVAIDLIRKSGKPVVLAVNKLDDIKTWERTGEYFALGLGEPHPVSALNGKGSGDLLDRITYQLAELGFDPDLSSGLEKEGDEEEQVEAQNIRVAIVGRPNVGKSTLVNSLCGEERVIVSDIPGTTRDAVDVDFEYKDQHITLIDTAGIRKRGKIEKGIEKYSVLRAHKAIDRASIVLVLIDPSEGLTAQDMHIMGYVSKQFKSGAVLVNKWDLVKSQAKENQVKLDDLVRDYTRELKKELGFIKYVPVMTISALSGQRVNKVLDLVLYLYEQRFIRLSDKQLRAIIKPAVAKRPTPTKRGISLKFYSQKQVEVDPPVIQFAVNDPRLVHFSYERYLKNCIRNIFPFEGCPLKFEYKIKSRSG